jgi:hypothetical protein
VGNRSGFAVIPVEGFNPERAKNIKLGMELTLGMSISAAVVFDRDYRSDDECLSIQEACSKFADLVTLHKCKEIENFLLIPPALDRAAQYRALEIARRGGNGRPYTLSAASILQQFANGKRSYVAAQYVAQRRAFERQGATHMSDATISELALREFEAAWSNPTTQLQIIPGKEAFSSFNRELADSSGFSITPTLVIDQMKGEEVPILMKELIDSIAKFSSLNPLPM